MTPWREHAFVVPAYGDSPHLEACLRSLMHQEVKSRICVTTSTPSAFIEACARAAGADLIVNPSREGIGADWNFALGSAGSRFVTLAHQDDIYAASFLNRTQDLFARNPGAALCFTGFQEIDSRGELRRSRVSFVKHLLSTSLLGGGPRLAGVRRRLFLSFGNPLPCSAVTFDLEQVPGFSFSTSQASNLDWDAWWRLHEENKIFLQTSEKLVGRRHDSLTATSALIRDGRRQQEDREMFERIWPAPLAATLTWLYRASYR